MVTTVDLHRLTDDQLTDHLVAWFKQTLPLEEHWRLIVPLLQGLASGQPVDPERLAALAGGAGCGNTARLDSDVQDRQQLQQHDRRGGDAASALAGSVGGQPVLPLGDEPERAGMGHGLGAVGRAELIEDVTGVLLHRLQRDHQLPGDLLVAPARGQQPQHLGNKVELVDHSRRNGRGGFGEPVAQVWGQQERLVAVVAQEL